MYSPHLLLSLFVFAFVGNTVHAADEKKASLDDGAVRVLETAATVDTTTPGFAQTYRAVIQDLRYKLGKVESRDELMKKLPTLTTKELVILWDGFWLESKVEVGPVPLAKLRDLDDLADGFAVKFNAASLAALATEKDATRQQLIQNIISPQQHTLTKEQAKELERLREKLKAKK